MGDQVNEWVGEWVGGRGVWIRELVRECWASVWVDGRVSE